jgi:ABC-2 type transport system ATP-binding protein
MTPPAQTALSIRQVTRRFGSIAANNRISIDIAPGDVVGLLGPNGAGKSTLIRICAGWLRADSGEVFIHGIRQSMRDLRPRRQLGVVSADAPLCPELTVNECLAWHAVLQGLSCRASREACSAALEQFKLFADARRPAGHLSLGLRQRLRLACASVRQPALLLLDEPTASLDPEMRRGIWDILRSLAAKGTAILMCTHDLQEAAHLCATVHLLLGGAIVCSMQPGKMNGAANRLEQEYLRAIQNEKAA